MYPRGILPRRYIACGSFRHEGMGRDVPAGEYPPWVHLTLCKAYGSSEPARSAAIAWMSAVAPLMAVNPDNSPVSHELKPVFHLD